MASKPVHPSRIKTPSTRIGILEGQGGSDPDVGQSGGREIISELEAKEAAMNGATVRYRRWPPYLRCNGCGGDGSSLRPYAWGCGGEHPPGWEIVEPPSRGAKR